jgi:hypothetical protein
MYYVCVFCLIVNYIKLSILAQQCFCGPFITGINNTYWSLCTLPVTALKHKNVRLIMTFCRRTYNFAKQILMTEKNVEQILDCFAVKHFMKSEGINRL